MKKYVFTGNTKMEGSIELKQIKRIKDGLIGGWIQDESNLSHEGDCFVYDNAMVFTEYVHVLTDFITSIEGDVKIMGNAKIRGCKINGNVEISGDTYVCNSELSGDIKIKDKAIVGDSTIIGTVRIYDNAYVHGFIKGNVKIFDNAKVYIRCGASIIGNVSIFENAKVEEYVEIEGNINIFGDSIVYGWYDGYARIKGNVNIYDRACISPYGEVYGNSNIYGESSIDMRYESVDEGRKIDLSNPMLEKIFGE